MLLIFNILIEYQYASGQSNAALYFISDCQEPLPIEKIIRKMHNNVEGRELLFREIEKKNDGYVFMLGDLVGKASVESEWNNVDSFLSHLRKAGTKVFAIPGNHEYLMNSREGITNYLKRFPESPITGYCIRTDSMAIVMLNSNFGELSETNLNKQAKWYQSVMDSLDVDSAIKLIIVCTHHSPFSNSKVVGSSVKVQEAFVPHFKSSPKTKLFMTGHSHNLEYFDGSSGKHFLVIGGGGGIDQPLNIGDKASHKDLIRQEIKPRFFYLIIKRRANLIEVTLRGFSRELTPISEICLYL